MTRFRTYSIAHGKIEGLTEKETRAKIHRSIKEIEAVCDIEYIAINAGGNLRYGFRPESEQFQGALGNSYPNGKIYLASVTQKGRWKVHLPFRRTVETVTQHEALHRLPFEFGHQSDTKSVMGPTANVQGFSPADVLRMQARVGPPKRTFYPLDRKTAAAKHSINMAKRVGLLAERAEHIAAKRWPSMLATQAKILINLRAIKASHAAWWKLNNAWAGVPMAHVQVVS